MMAKSASFIVLVTALLISTLSYCSAKNVYCVTPASCSSCPHNSTHNATLSEYAQEAETYFTSDTTMVFLAGDHVLDMNITVANVARLTMRGESSPSNIAKIVRNGSVGFSFTNMVDFSIYFLAFTSNRSWSYGSHPASNSALLLNSTQNAKLVNCSFHDTLGTALTVYNTNITLAENSKFIRNQCGCELFTGRCGLGCGITVYNSILTFTGNTNFFRNSKKGPGSAIHIMENAVLTFSGTNNFINNSGSAIYASANTVLNFTGASNFIGNHATRYYGGSGGSAIYALWNVTLTSNGTNNFINNSGSAIYTSANTVLIFNGTNNFIGNHATRYYGGSGGSAIYALWNVAVTFNGTNNFINNSAKGASGGAIHARVNISLTFIGNSNFSNNSAQGNGGGIYAATNISLSFTGKSNFSRNSAMQGGAISAIAYSTLTFNGTNRFTNNGHTTNEFNINNGVSCGGAMYLAISSSFSIFTHTTMRWENNHANLGGAICVSDANPSIYCTQFVQFNIQKEKCFFQLSRPGQHLSGSQFVFNSNYADYGGSVLFGGAIDNCELHGVNTHSSGEVFDMLIIDNDNNTASNISSDPIKICPCEKNLPKCNRSSNSILYPLKEYPVSHIRVYPGETFQISVVAVGQRGGTVSRTVRSTVTSTTTIFHSVNLLDYQYLQQTKSTCTELNYTVFSLSQRVKIEMHPEGSPCYYNSKLQYWLVQLNQTCPPGFNISEEARSCVCDPRLAHYTNQCNITNGVGRITRDSSQHFWVGYDNSSHELILHPYCPFDYCVNDIKVFPLNNTDAQCAHNRSGLLCGHCKEGYSLVLGTHHCRKCTNSHLALLIAFAVMGVALVFLLLVCKLTVATGTLSGLVFYANIVEPNRTIFLPAGSTNAFSVFIAWLNLDFGIETCFYNGMDASSKTWLQFVFPVYIWVLIGLMIVVSHYSQRFANLLGSNPVSVLATLILLSYTKVLRTLIFASCFADLDYPNNSTRRVWLHDANIDYLFGKHIPLSVLAILFLFLLFLSYTLLLLFGQWLQAVSHLRLFSWVNSARLKPFMDAYHAPYKAKHRYWPGLLLVLRFVLTLVFAFNDPSISLLAIVVGAGILQLWAWVSGGVYKNWCLDALEAQCS